MKLEDRYLLDGGQNSVPDPGEADLPCTAEPELWSGDAYGRKHRLESYQEAASICLDVCAVKNPAAFKACKEIGQQLDDPYMVYGGDIPANWEEYNK